MHSEAITEIKMAQRFYYLAIKFEDKVTKDVVIFAKETCDKYTKMAKSMNIKLKGEELIRTILK